MNALLNLKLFKNYRKFRNFTYEATSAHGLLDKVSGSAEKSRQVGHGVIVYMETKVGYAMQRILGRVDWYVTFSGVQNMRHTNFSQVLHVLNSFAVTQNDAWINLKLSKNQYETYVILIQAWILKF